ncbi:transglutaminase domain-containing protein [Micromonospora sp. NPDC049089]|uniref:transglutaminase domain-containing protein n=1 Tax=Micromonospora sp. NPDC049089 TaxID=3155496 RepID=UPI003405E2E1
MTVARAPDRRVIGTCRHFAVLSCALLRYRGIAARARCGFATYGRIDAAQFGVYGTENWGPAEIRGKAIKDLAALNKVEMLPWDEWGRMDTSYQGKTGPEYDALIDKIAAVSATDNHGAIADLYVSEDFAVPAELMR